MWPTPPFSPFFCNLIGITSICTRNIGVLGSHPPSFSEVLGLCQWDVRGPAASDHGVRATARAPSRTPLSQRFGAPDDAQAARGTSYAQTSSRRAAQVGHQPSAGRCVAAVPHQQLGPTAQAAAARSRSHREKGGGAVGSLNRALAGRGVGRVHGRVSEFSFPGARKGLPERS